MLLHAGVLQNRWQQMSSFRWNSLTFPTVTLVPSFFLLYLNKSSLINRLCYSSSQHAHISVPNLGFLSQSGDCFCFRIWGFVWSPETLHFGKTLVRLWLSTWECKRAGKAKWIWAASFLAWIWLKTVCVWAGWFSSVHRLFVTYSFRKCVNSSFWQ